MTKEIIECGECGKECKGKQGLNQHQQKKHTVPYKEKETFKEVYFDDTLTLPEVADELDCSPVTVNRWAKKHDLPKRGQMYHRAGKEHTNKEKLEELYNEEKLSKQEIAERYGIDPKTVLHHLERHNIERRSIKEAHRVKPIKMYTDTLGYERVSSGGVGLAIHRLVAIAKGANPHKVFSDGVDVHHKNNVQWDNRPENVEALPKEQHMRKEMNIRYNKTSYEAK